MASNLNTILDKVVTALELINGAGVYTYDVSDGQSVIFGAEVYPARAPRINIFEISVATDFDAPLSEYRRLINLQLVGYVAAANDTPESKVKAANNLLNDIMRALEADAQLSSTIIDLDVDARTFDGLEFGLNSMGIVYAQVELRYHQDTGI